MAGSARIDHAATIIGAGRTSRRQLDRALSLAPRLIAADGGGASALAHGHMPELVIGDMDSINGDVADRLPVDALRRISSQQDTDFEKCLQSVTTPLIIGLGVTEPRIDHGLASLNVMVRHAHRRIIVFTESDALCLSPPKIAIDMAVGDRLSLFPLASVEGRSHGLKWPINDIRFEPFGRTGTSNEASGETVELEFDAPGMILIAAERYLEEFARAVSRQPMWRTGIV